MASDPPASDTREQILDAAEAVVVRQGVRNFRRCRCGRGERRPGTQGAVYAILYSRQLGHDHAHGRWFRQPLRFDHDRAPVVS